MQRNHLTERQERVLSRFSSLVLFTILSSAPLPAQTSLWQAAVGLGAATNHHRQKGGVAAVGELSGRFFHRGIVELSANATGAYFLPATDYVCATGATPSSCDLRVFSRFGALTLAANAEYTWTDYTYYVRAGVGPWWGSDVDASAEQSSAERGALITTEIGTRNGRLEVGFEQKRIEGTRFGMIPLLGLVVRVAF
jgi:hypothetical protein